MLGRLLFVGGVASILSEEYFVDGFEKERRNVDVVLLLATTCVRDLSFNDFIVDCSSFTFLPW